MSEREREREMEGARGREKKRERVEGGRKAERGLGGGQFIQNCTPVPTRMPSSRPQPTSPVTSSEKEAVRNINLSSIAQSVCEPV